MKNAMQKVKTYLSNYNIEYYPFNESNRPLIISDVDCIVIPCSVERALKSSCVLDEETGDIYNGVQIIYETLEEFFYDVMDYVLNFQKQLLEDICIPIVMTQTGQWDFNKARVYIDSELMHSPIE